MGEMNFFGLFLFFVLSMCPFIKAQNRVISETESKSIHIKKTIVFSENWIVTDANFDHAKAKHKSFEDTYIYSHTVPMRAKADSLESIINFEIESYKEFASDMLEIKMLPPLLTDQEKSIAFLRWVKWGSDAAHQLVAFIPEVESIFMLTLSSNEIDDFEQIKSDFEKLVQSYILEKEIRYEVTKNTFY